MEDVSHDAGMSAQHEHEPNDDHPADSFAHGYRSDDAACIPVPAAIRVASTTARCSLLARVAVALGTRLIQATYPQAPCVVVPVAYRIMRANAAVIVASLQPGASGVTGEELLGQRSAGEPFANKRDQ
jgi:hypothetical protein